jgi:hypothetical protein
MPWGYITLDAPDPVSNENDKAAVQVLAHGMASICH